MEVAEDPPFALLSSSPGAGDSTCAGQGPRQNRAQSSGSDHRERQGHRPYHAGKSSGHHQLAYCGASVISRSSSPNDTWRGRKLAI